MMKQFIWISKKRKIHKEIWFVLIQLTKSKRISFLLYWKESYMCIAHSIFLQHVSSRKMCIIYQRRKSSFIEQKTKCARREKSNLTVSFILLLYNLTSTHVNFDMRETSCTLYFANEMLNHVSCCLFDLDQGKSTSGINMVVLMWCGLLLIIYIKHSNNHVFLFLEILKYFVVNNLVKMIQYWNFAKLTGTSVWKLRVGCCSLPHFCQQ